MALSVADLPDKKTLSVQDLPDKGLDPSSLPDQHDNTFPSTKLAHDVVRTIEDVAVPELNLGEAIGAAMKSDTGKKVQGAVSDAMGQISQAPGMQPLTLLKPDVPRGTPLEQVGGSMKEVAEFPMRFGNTLQEPQVWLQNATKEKLIKKGVNPYLATFYGMAAGVVADPINLVAAAEIGSGLSAYSKSRQALKMALLDEDGLRAKSIAANIPAATPPVPDLPTIPPGSKAGPPHALFAYNDNFGPGESERSIYNVFGDPNHPAIKERGWGSSVPKEDLDKLGIPVTGRQPGSEKFTPLDPIKRPEPVGPTGYVPTSSVQSAETDGEPRPVSDVWLDTKSPKNLNTWKDASINELHDLHTSLELTSPTPDAHADLMSTLRRYVGHEELARFDSDKMVDEMSDYIPDKDRRSLVTLYSQLGRPPTTEEVNSLRTATEGAKEPGVKEINRSMNALLQQDLSLSPKEQELLKSYNGYFDGMGQRAKEMGIIPNLREAYGGPHLYMPKEDAAQGFTKRLLSGRSRFAQPRTFDTVFDAIKAGHVPRTLDAAELISVYHKNISRAAAEKYMMSSLEKQGLINFEGNGRQIKTFQGNMRKIQGELYARQAYSDNPEVQKVMARAAEDPVLDNTMIRALEKVNSWQKTATLYLQIFHPKALAAEAIAKGFSPARFKDGLDLIEAHPEYVRGMIRSGLIVNDVPDIGKQLASHVTSAKNYANPLTFVKKINDIYSDAIFGKYMTGLKVYNSNYMMKRLINMGVPQERSVQLAVEDSNRVFGGLNLRLMSRSPNMQRLFQLVSFAPDWTESKLRQMGAPFGVGLGDVTPQEAKILASQSRQYWVNLTALATTTHLLNMVNPANRVVSLDLSQESGFKDVKKLLLLATLNPAYFTSKASSLVRDMATLMDPHIRADKKFKQIVQQTMPISLQNLTRNKN